MKRFRHHCWPIKSASRQLAVIVRRKFTPLRGTSYTEKSDLDMLRYMWCTWRLKLENQCSFFFSDVMLATYFRVSSFNALTMKRKGSAYLKYLQFFYKNSWCRRTNVICSGHRDVNFKTTPGVLLASHNTEGWETRSLVPIRQISVFSEPGARNWARNSRSLTGRNHRNSSSEDCFPLISCGWTF